MPSRRLWGILPENTTTPESLNKQQYNHLKMAPSTRSTLRLSTPPRIIRAYEANTIKKSSGFAPSSATTVPHSRVAGESRASISRSPVKSTWYLERILESSMPVLDLRLVLAALKSCILRARPLDLCKTHQEAFTSNLIPIGQTPQIRPATTSILLQVRGHAELVPSGLESSWQVASPLCWG
jgi:hypothetical protein